MQTPNTTWPVWSVQQLRAAGWTRANITDAVRDKSVWRVRRGYYAGPATPPAIVRAVRLGGRLTAASALAMHGVWVRDASIMHVLVPSNAARLSNPDARFEPLRPGRHVHVHWQGPERVKRDLLRYSPVVDVATAIEHLALCGSIEDVVAAVDSALNLRKLRPGDARELAGRLEKDIARAVLECDGRAQAGGESVVRFRLRAKGLRVEVQVHFDGVGRVDLVVEGRLVIEIDGRAHHATADQFAEDRRRDRALALLGVPRLRFTYAQVFEEWETTLQAIMAELARA